MMKFIKFAKQKDCLKYVALISLIFVGACSKRAPVPEVEVTRLEAEHAMARAQSEIYEAREAGADVSEAEEILGNAQSYLEGENYRRARDEAQRAEQVARELRQDILAKLRAKSDAESAIERAERFISKAEELGGNISEPQDFLDRSMARFEEEDYEESINLADQAADLAQGVIDTLTADTYVVGTWESDRACLWNIAARRDIYNDPWKWKRIYQANSQKIDDPDLIFPNQEFVIPRD
ncbi:MAG: hypothetical protein ACQESB_01625 [Elusimicrobiota bacterium]